MDERPVSVTVISWTLIVFGGFGWLGCLFMWMTRDTPVMQQAMARIPAPIDFIIALAFFGVTLRVACAVAFLFRQGWARYVYLVLAVVMMAYGFYTSPYPLLIIPNLVFTAVVAFILFRPAAQRWFNGRNGVQPAG